MRKTFQLFVIYVTKCMSESNCGLETEAANFVGSQRWNIKELLQTFRDYLETGANQVKVACDTKMLKQW